MKWTGEQYKCRNCGEVYPYSLSKCRCGGVCDKIADTPPDSSQAQDSGQSVLSNILKSEKQKDQDKTEKELARLYEAVKEACSKNEYYVAISYLEQILELKPDSQEAKDLLDFCNNKIEQTKQSRENENSMNEEKLIKLANQLSESQNRKTSLAFDFMMLFGSSLRAKMNLDMLLISIIIMILFFTICIYDEFNFTSIWEMLFISLFFLLQPIVWCIVFCFQIVPYKTLLRVFKNGQFTIGHRENERLITFTDFQGNQRFCRAPYIQDYVNDKHPYLIVYDKLNRDNNFAMRVSQVGDILDLFTIIPFVEENPCDLKFHYNLTNQTFVKGLDYIWLRFAIMVLCYLAINLVAYIYTFLNGLGFAEWLIIYLVCAGGATTFVAEASISRKHLIRLCCLINPIILFSVVILVLNIILVLCGALPN